MNEISTTNHTQPSPFDAIKRTREDGAHYQRSDGTTSTSYTTRVQPSGIEFTRRKLGLPKPVMA